MVSLLLNLFLSISNSLALLYSKMQKTLDFRHTFGSQLAMKGESLYKISTLMGNSPDICRRHYAALIPETLTDSVEFCTTTSSKFMAG